MIKKHWTSKEYNSFRHALSRCNNSNNQFYKNYGGRGIKVLYKSFEEFVSDLGPKPKNSELDRINNDGNYEIGNCRWTSIKKNRLNKRVQKSNTSGIRGVYFRKDNKKWFSGISIDNKFFKLSQFDNPEDAHQEYLQYYFIQHGEYPPEFMI